MNVAFYIYLFLVVINNFQRKKVFHNVHYTAFYQNPAAEANLSSAISGM